MEKHAKSEEAKQITFDDLDADGNGEIDRQELTQFLFDQRMLHSEVFWNVAWRIYELSKGWNNAKIDRAKDFKLYYWYMD